MYPGPNQRTEPGDREESPNDRPPKTQVRMPSFPIKADEARGLVDYFAGHSPETGAQLISRRRDLP